MQEETKWKGMYVSEGGRVQNLVWDMWQLGQKASREFGL